MAGTIVNELLPSEAAPAVVPAPAVASDVVAPAPAVAEDAGQADVVVPAPAIAEVAPAVAVVAVVDEIAAPAPVIGAEAPVGDAGVDILAVFEVDIHGREREMAYGLPYHTTPTNISAFVFVEIVAGSGSVAGKGVECNISCRNTYGGLRWAHKLMLPHPRGLRVE